MGKMTIYGARGVKRSVFVAPFVSMLISSLVVADGEVNADLSASDNPEQVQNSLPELSSDFFAAESDRRDAQVEETTHAVMNAAASLAQQDSAEGRADLATDQTINYFSQELVGATESWFNRLGTAQFNLDISTRGVFGEFDVLVPLNRESMQERYFMQLGGVINDDDSYSGRDFINVGAGYRSIVPESAIGPYMWGLNNFYDFDVSRGNVRSSVGGEFVYDAIKASTNIYFPLSNWQESEDTFDSLDNISLLERPASGYDINIEGYVPSYPQLGYGLSWAQFFGEWVEMSDGSAPEKDPIIVDASVSYTPFPLMSVRAGVTSEAGETQGNVGVQMNYDFGQSLSAQLEPSNVGANKELTRYLDQTVNRDKNIRLEYQASVALDVALETSYSVMESQPLTIAPQMQSAHGIKSVTFTGAFADYFERLNNEHVGLFTAPSAKADSIENAYPLNVVVEDNRGNIARASTMIYVSVDSSLIPEIILDDAYVVYGDIGTLEWGFTNPRDNGERSSSTPASFSYGGDATVALLDESFSPKWDAGLFPRPNGSHPYRLTITATDDAGFTTAKDVKITLVEWIVNIDDVTEVTPPSSVPANGQDEVLVEVTISDDKTGTPAEGVELQVSVDNHAKVEQEPSDANGVVRLRVTSTVAGTKPLHIRVPTGEDSQVIDVTFVGDSDSALLKPGSITVSESSVVANANDEVEITALVVDSNQNPVSGVEATLSNYGSAQIVGGSPTVKSDDSGLVKFSLTSQVAEALTPEIKVDKSTETAQLEFVADHTSAVIELIHTTVDQVIANGSAEAQVEVVLEDGFGNALPSHTVTWQSQQGASVTRGSTTTDENGKTQVGITSRNVGHYNITAELENGVSGKAPVEFVAHNGEGSHFESGSLSMTVDNQPADTQPNIAQVRVINGDGSPVQGQSVNWSVDNADFVLDSDSSESDKDGWAQVLVHSQVVGEGAVTVELNGKTLSVDTTFVLDSSNVDMSEVSSPSGPIVADDVTMGTIEVLLVDVNGDPVAGLPVSWRAPSGMTFVDKRMSAQTTSTTHTNESGIASIQVRSNTVVSGDVTARFESEELSFPVSFVADPSTAGYTILRVEQQGIIGQNGQDAEIRVRLEDRMGNPFAGIQLDIDTPVTVENATDKTNASGEVVYRFSHNSAGYFNAQFSSSELPMLGTESRQLSFAELLTPVVRIENGQIKADGREQARVTVTVTPTAGIPFENVTIRAVTPVLDDVYRMDKTEQVVSSDDNVAEFLITGYSEFDGDLKFEIDDAEIKESASLMIEKLSIFELISESEIRTALELRDVNFSSIENYTMIRTMGSDEATTSGSFVTFDGNTVSPTLNFTGFNRSYEAVGDSIWVTGQGELEALLDLDVSYPNLVESSVRVLVPVMGNTSELYLNGQNYGTSPLIVDEVAGRLRGFMVSESQCGVFTNNKSLEDAIPSSASNTYSARSNNGSMVDIQIINGHRNNHQHPSAPSYPYYWGYIGNKTPHNLSDKMIISSWEDLQDLHRSEHFQGNTTTIVATNWISNGSVMDGEGNIVPAYLMAPTGVHGYALCDN